MRVIMPEIIVITRQIIDGNGFSSSFTVEPY